MIDPETPAPEPIYTEHAPAHWLSRYVECYWSVVCRLAPDARQPGRVLPDGCMDILFNLGDPPPGARRPERATDSAATAIGSMTRAIEVAYGGRVVLVGVRFRPGGATPWIDGPAAELTDDIVGLEQLWGADARRASERLREAGDRERITVLDDILTERLGKAARPADERVLRASAAVAAADGRLPVERLADATGLGRRQLERRFLACVGVSPKTASRIARFRFLVARMHADAASPLSRLAADAGYADQAHMSREFRALAGMTPGAYVAEMRSP